MKIEQIKKIPYCDYSFFVRGRKLRVRCVTSVNNSSLSFDLTKSDLRGICRYYWDRLTCLLYNHDVYLLPFDWKIEQSYSHLRYHDLACYLRALLRDLEIVSEVPYPYFSKPLEDFDILPYCFPSSLLKCRKSSIDIEVCTVKDKNGYVLGFVPILSDIKLHAFRSATELRKYVRSLYAPDKYNINLLIH